MILFILFQTSLSSSLFDYSSNNNITNLFNGCNMAGENKANFLFQCNEMNVIIPKLELQKEEVYSYSFNSSENVQLSNFLLSELHIDQESLNYQVQLYLLYFSGYGEQLDPIRSKQGVEYQFYDYKISVIDGILNVIGFFISYQQSNYASLYLISMYSGKINDHYPFILNFTCDNQCKIIDYKQQYIQQRNCILIIILEQNQVNIFEFSLFDKIIRTISQNHIGDINDQNNKIISAQLIGQYYLIHFQNNKALYYITTALFEFKLIQYLSIEPIVINEKYGYLFQKSDQKTKFYQINQQQSWFSNLSFTFIDDLNIKFSQSIIVLNEKQFIFIYDNFRFQLFETDLKQLEINQEQNCTYPYDTFPEINNSSLQYQLKYFQDNIKFTQNENKSISQLQGRNQCEIPCDIIYQEFDIQLIPYEQQCIISQLENLFTKYCTLLNDCFSCMSQIGCAWIQNQCDYEQELYEVDISSNFQSSKWYFGKQLMCEEKNEDLMNNFCSYNQTLFDQEKILQFNGQIEKGHICSWFFDAKELQQFLLTTETDFLKTPAKIKASLCIGETSTGICKQVNIENWNQSYQSYLFHGYYFRYSLVFLEDILANNITLKVQNSTPVTFMDKIKQSLIQMIAWLLCGLFFFFLMGYIAKRRLQYLIAQTMDIELHFIQNAQLQNNQVLPLSNQVLENVMKNLKDQEIITNYPSNCSVLIFGEENCAFCFDNYIEQQMITQLFCGHAFHLECFENWIRIKGVLEKCPVCNQKVDHFLANKEQFAQIKSQIQERIIESDQNTTNLIE